jgi:hypothetical protein
MKKIREIQKISNKRLGIKLFSEGHFGNTMVCYESPEELLADKNAPKMVGIRYRDAGGGKCEYDIPLARVEERWAAWIKEGSDPKLMYMNDANNYDPLIVIQGEV